MRYRVGIKLQGALGMVQKCSSWKSEHTGKSAYSQADIIKKDATAIYSISSHRLYYTVSTRCPTVSISCSDSTLLQQPHQLPHSIMHHDFCITFHQDIQLRIVIRTRFFSSSVEGSFCGDGGARRFEDFGDIGSIGDSPTSLFCRSISILSYR